MIMRFLEGRDLSKMNPNIEVVLSKTSRSYIVIDSSNQSTPNPFSAPSPSENTSNPFDETSGVTTSATANSKGFNHSDSVPVEFPPIDPQTTGEDKEIFPDIELHPKGNTIGFPDIALHAIDNQGSFPDIELSVVEEKKMEKDTANISRHIPDIDDLADQPPKPQRKVSRRR
jgi:hypothetical protein